MFNQLKYKEILNLIRWDKPTGTLLLFFPCAFGTALNAKTLYEYHILFLFFIGSFLMRSAGCIINDIFDKNYDIKVYRTKSRPIASGKIGISFALFICALLSLLGLLVLTFFSTKTIFFSLISIPLIIIYPLTKRFTYFPQFFLGCTFNFGILVASIELVGEVTFPSFILYIGTIFWTAGYDTIYGFMDLEDDKKIGVKSLSLYIKNKAPKIWLLCFYAIFIISLYIASSINTRHLSFLSILVLALLLCQFIWQIHSLDIANRDNCLYSFKSNIISGILAFIFIVASSQT